MINKDKLIDTQTIADKLANLPKEALIYIAGYSEGYKDKLGKETTTPPIPPASRRGKKHPSSQRKEAR